MGKRSGIIFACAFLAGCVSVNPPQSENRWDNGVAQESSLMELNGLIVGITHDEARAVMDQPITIGYESPETDTSQSKPFTLSNPYRVETLTIDAHEYVVEYYFYRIVKADDIVSEDELLPLVFSNDILVGKGHDYLFKLKSL